MLTQSLKTTLAVSLVVGGMSLAGSAYAAGSGSTNSTITPTCKKGLAWDKKKRKCVKVEKTGQLDDNNLFEAARDLAYNKRYDEAINLLNLAQNQDDLMSVISSTQQIYDITFDEGARFPLWFAATALIGPMQDRVP